MIKQYFYSISYYSVKYIAKNYWDNIAVSADICLYAADTLIKEKGLTICLQM